MHRVYNSWYCLPEPVACAATVGLCTKKGVTLRYDRKGPQQCARFYIAADLVPEEERSTRIVKVAEVKLKPKKVEGCESGFKTKLITTVPEAAFEAMQAGESVPDDVVAQLNQCLAANKSKSSSESERLWAALQGKSQVCIYIS